MQTHFTGNSKIQRASEESKNEFCLHLMACYFEKLMSGNILESVSLKLKETNVVF